MDRKCCENICLPRGSQGSARYRSAALLSGFADIAKTVQFCIRFLLNCVMPVGVQPSQCI